MFLAGELQTSMLLRVLEMLFNSNVYDLCDFFCLLKTFCRGCHHLFLCSKAQRTWYNCLDLQQKMNCMDIGAYVAIEQFDVVESIL